MKRFRPGIVPTLVVAVLLPMLVSLGFWQLSRGAEKSALLQSYTERRAAEPMASTELQPTADPAFRRVHLHGQFDAAHSLLLDNRQRDGKVGVEIHGAERFLASRDLDGRSESQEDFINARQGGE